MINKVSRNDVRKADMHVLWFKISGTNEAPRLKCV